MRPYIDFHWDGDIDGTDHSDVCSVGAFSLDGALARLASFLRVAPAETLNQGKLPIFFSLAVSCQQRSILFPPPLEFYLQKILINRLYAVIPFHSLNLAKKVPLH